MGTIVEQPLPLNVASYHRLVALKAIESWKKYPKPMQARFEVEDMIQDGLYFTFEKVVPRWKPSKGKFTTILFPSLHNFYFNEWIRLSRERRMDWGVLSIDAVREQNGEVVRGIVNRMTVMEEQAAFVPEWMKQLHVHVVRSVLGVYCESSGSLRESMRRWFLPNYHTSKVHIHSHRFKLDRREFLPLAKKHEVDRMDCEILMTSNKCQKQVFEGLPENQVVVI